MMLSTRKKPNIQMLNFRRQSAVTLVAKQSLSRRTGKQETFYDLTNSAGYPAKYATHHVKHNMHTYELEETLNEVNGRNPRKMTICTNLLKEGSDNMFTEERRDFWEHMQGVCDSALTQMFDMDIAGTATAARKKAAKYYKKLNPEQIEQKALETFKKKMQKSQ